MKPATLKKLKMAKDKEGILEDEITFKTTNEIRIDERIFRAMIRDELLRVRHSPELSKVIQEEMRDIGFQELIREGIQQKIKVKLQHEIQYEFMDFMRRTHLPKLKRIIADELLKPEIQEFVYILLKKNSEKIINQILKEALDEDENGKNKE
jgi:uncharacterized membrane-anchored protein YjiN (DUF445 family)